jgi:predicted phosphodiesterase
MQTRQTTTRRRFLGALRAGASVSFVLGCFLGQAAFAAAGAVKILEVNDMHIVDEASLAYPRKVVAAMNREGGDLAIVPGDLAKDGKRSELLLAKKVLDGLKMPYVVVQGNHDVLYKGEKEETVFREVFSLKSNSYHVTAKGIHFLMIAHGCGKAYQNNAVRPEVLAWMRKTLGGIRDDKPYILVSHYPFARGVKYRTPNADEVLSLFKGRRLLAVMSGHFHGNTEKIENGVLMTTTACASGTRGNHDRTKAKGYRVFHIDGNLNIKTEFREVVP